MATGTLQTWAWIILQVQCDHKRPCKRETGGQSQEGDVVMETEVRVMSSEDVEGAMSQGMRAPLEGGKGKETFSPRDSRGNAGLPTP